MSYKNNNSTNKIPDISSATWSEFESLIVKAGGNDGGMLQYVVSRIAAEAGTGIIPSGFAYQAISDVVSTIRRKVNNGKFDVFLNCLAILCDDGDLLIDDLNEFLEDNEIGYIAGRYGMNNSVSLVPIDEGEDEVDISDDKPLILLGNDTKVVKSKEELKRIQKEMKGKEQKNMRDSIFISHRYLDKDVADMIFDFLVSCGVPQNKIFCSSLPGNDVDTSIPTEVKQRLKESAVNIMILSSDYYCSAFCLNEAGIIWYFEDEAAVVPIGLPEIKEKDMVGFIDRNKILRRLDNDTDIAKILYIIKEKLKLSSVDYAIIMRETKKLKERYEDYISKRKK